MQIFFALLRVFLVLAFGVFLLLAIHTMFKTVWVVFFSKKFYYDGMTFRRACARARWRIRTFRYHNYIEFVKWVIIDTLRGKDRLKLFGIWLFTGYFGEGKTLGAVTFARGLQKKYPARNIQIATNFDCRGQFKKITCWEDMLDLPPNTIIIFDEIQSTFESQRFKDFPIELLWKITQCRKRRLMILASSPVYQRVVIYIRENTDFVIACKNVWGLDRWFNYHFYHAVDYERAQTQLLGMMRSKKYTISLVAQDNDYRQYNTFQEVDRLDIVPEDKKKPYLKHPKVKEVLTMLDRLEVNDANIQEVNKAVRDAVSKLRKAV